MKHITHNLKIFAVVLTAIFISTSGLAAGGKGVISLNPTKAHANASGTAFIDNEHVSIQARGLKSSSIYTVWFVNTKPKKHETGAGKWKLFSSPWRIAFWKMGNGYDRASSDR